MKDSLLNKLERLAVVECQDESSQHKNRTRIHETLGFVSPVSFEKRLNVA